jgi:hypothetical protein
VADNVGGNTYNVRNTNDLFVPIGFTGYSGASIIAQNISINPECDIFTVLVSGNYRISTVYSFYANPWPLTSDYYLWINISSFNAGTIRDFSMPVYANLTGQGPDYSCGTQTMIVYLDAGDRVFLHYKLLPNAPLGSPSGLFLGVTPNALTPGDSPGPNVGISLTMVRIGD